MLNSWVERAVPKHCMVPVASGECLWFPGTQCSTFCIKTLNTGKLTPNSIERVTTYFLLIVLLWINLFQILQVLTRLIPRKLSASFLPDISAKCFVLLQRCHKFLLFIFSVTGSNVQCFGVFVSLWLCIPGFPFQDSQCFQKQETETILGEF